MRKPRKYKPQTVVHNQSEYTDVPPQHTTDEIKTFKDQAIAVLNELTRRGDDIYDPNRTPGMYLRNNRSKDTSIFKNNSNQIKSETNDSSTDESFKNIFK